MCCRELIANIPNAHTETGLTNEILIPLGHQYYAKKMHTKTVVTKCTHKNHTVHTDAQRLYIIDATDIPRLHAPKQVSKARF